jgi:hypothetical protein
VVSSTNRCLHCSCDKTDPFSVPIMLSKCTLRGRKTLLQFTCPGSHIFRMWKQEGVLETHFNIHPAYRKKIDHSISHAPIEKTHLYQWGSPPCWYSANRFANCNIDCKVGMTTAPETDRICSEKEIERRATEGMRLTSLVRAYQVVGHLKASLDPLRLQKRPPLPLELQYTSYGFTGMLLCFT